MTDELHFVNTDFASIKEWVLTKLEEYVEEPLYPLDERRIFGEALAYVASLIYNDVDDATRQKMLEYARGTVLDALGARVSTPRLTSEPATTTVRFITNTAQAQNIIIPRYTKVTVDNSLYFETTQAAVLQAGALSVDIPVQSMAGGSKYNGVPIGAIGTLVDLIPGITGVTNLTETTGGNDGEPYTEAGDNHYRERIKLAPAAFSTAGAEDAYRYHALSANPNIMSVQVIRPEPGHITVIPLMAGGELPTQDILDEVTKALSPKTVRPMTDYVHVQSPEVQQYDIDFVYYVTLDTQTAAVEAIEGANGAIQQYINWQSGKLGRDLNPDQLRRFVLAPDWADGLTGALRIDVTSPQHTEIDDFTVAQFSGNLTVTHEVVTE